MATGDSIWEHVEALERHVEALERRVGMLEGSARKQRKHQPMPVAPIEQAIERAIDKSFGKFTKMLHAIVDERVKASNYVGRARVRALEERTTKLEQKRGR